MTYQEFQKAESAHELAAKLLRYSGFRAKAVKNFQAEFQPCEVEIFATLEEVSELQPMMERLCKYPINLVRKDNLSGATILSKEEGKMYERFCDGETIVNCNGRLWWTGEKGLGNRVTNEESDTLRGLEKKGVVSLESINYQL